MSFTALCTILVFFYVLIWFFDSFFKSCMHYPYYAFLEGTGLKVGLLNFSWTTTAFNRLIYRFSKSVSRFLQRWFTFGLLVTIGGFLPFAIYTLLSIIYEHFNDTIPITNGPELIAMIPGINVPSSDYFVYFVTLAISTIVHEFGHAMAATHEEVQLLSVGICIVLCVPIAFVELNSDHMNTATVTKKLKIYCAGIWHNLVCAFIALLLFLSTPILFNIGYASNVGMRVTGFSHDSPLKDVRGMETKDVIIAINGCKIKNMKDYMYCLHSVRERFGICTSTEFIAQHDEVMMESFKENDVVECCGNENQHSFCFEYMEPKVAGDSILPAQYSCLKPRNMVQEEFVKCTEAKGYNCPRNMHCLKPSLHNNTFFMVIERRDNTPILYLGSPQDVHKSVHVDQYFPRSAMFATFSPMSFEKFLRYLFMFSMGVGFINVIPCYGTDGHHIAKILIQVLAKVLNKNGDFVTFFTVFSVVVGTGITVPIMFYLFFKVVLLDGTM